MRYSRFAAKVVARFVIHTRYKRVIGQCEVLDAIVLKGAVKLRSTVFVKHTPSPITFIAKLSSKECIDFIVAGLAALEALVIGV